MARKLRPEEKEYIVKQYKKGKSAQEIADALGITANTVNKYEIRLGLRKQNYTWKKKPECPKQVKRPVLKPGQWLRIPVQEGMIGEPRLRDAVVLEPHERFGTVGVLCRYSDGIIRSSYQYWDMVHKLPLVM